METKLQVLSDEEKLALNHAKVIGKRTWKKLLRESWESGNYHGYADWATCILQRLRNASYFGPAGLVRW